jgi:hypothetical protein
MAKTDKPFVKSSDTSTSVANSRAELERILRRYGAQGFSVAQDYANHSVTVSFIVPDSLKKDAHLVPVKLPISVRRVYDAMYGQPTKSVRRTDEEIAQQKARHGYIQSYNRQVYNEAGYDAKKLEQAERVAWRNICLWVDAALSAAVAGMQTITEAFFAHAVVGANGQRMIEVVEEAQQALGGGVQRLLAAPAEVE